VFLLGPAILAFLVGLPWNVLLGLGTIVALVFVVRRAFRIAVVIDSDGVTVSNLTRVDRLAWPEISAIELREDPAPGDTVIRCVAFVRRGSDDPVVARAPSASRPEGECSRPCGRWRGSGA
jgi:hypothetical protein